MLKSSVAVLAGVGLLSTVLLAQSSQPSGSQSSPKQPPHAQAQPQQVPQPGAKSGPAKANSSPQGPLRLKMIRVPRKEPKALPIGILDRATPA
jgi:hypothetical protein